MYLFDIRLGHCNIAKLLCDIVPYSPTGSLWCGKDVNTFTEENPLHAVDRVHYFHFMATLGLVKVW